ncbi:hypothetical protein C2S51_008705 [Perilla frutescens var. frutescens]|nr:hypothetical protein C2S51_008705 [Perilla frutescens var. frutescens]
MATSSSSSDSLSFATLLHMVTLKLTSSSYLLWRNQMESILDCQNLNSFIDGSVPPPSFTINDKDNVLIRNPTYADWQVEDMRIDGLLLSSLTEESMAAVIRSSTSREMKKSSCSIINYGRLFKASCDQLTAMGRSLDDTDKARWFLRGLSPRGNSYRSHNNGGRRSNQTTKGNSSGRPRRFPRYQIYRGPHYADRCTECFNHDITYATANLTEPFNADCKSSHILKGNLKELNLRLLSSKIPLSHIGGYVKLETKK